MATRKKHLINVHTSTGTTAPTAADLRLGEIAVQHTSENPALWIKMGNAESSAVYEKFIGSTEIKNYVDGSVSAITEALDNYVSGITMNGEAKSPVDGIVDLGTVVTAETQLSTAVTGTGNVVTNLTVSGHKITMNKAYSAAPADQFVTLSGAAHNKITALSAGTIALVGSSAASVFSSAKTYTDNEIGKLDSTGHTTDSGHYLTSVTITNGKITAVGEQPVPGETDITTATSGNGNVISNLTVTGHQITMVKGVTAATSAQVSTLSAATHAHVTNGDIHVTAAQKTAWTNGSNSGASAYTGVTQLSGVVESLEDGVAKIAVTAVTVSGTGNAVVAATYSDSALTLGKGDVQAVITDLATIRTNAASGMQAYNDVRSLSAATTGISQTLNTVSGAAHNKITTLSAATTVIGQGLSNLSAATLSAVTAKGDNYIDASVASRSAITVTTKQPVVTDLSTAISTTGSLADAKAIKTYIDNTLSSTVTYKGATASLPSNPAIGDMWVAASAFTAGGHSVEVGDFVIARTSGASAQWDVIEKNLDGAITGSLTANTVTLGESTNSVKSLANGASGTVLAMMDGIPGWTNAVKVSSASVADNALKVNNHTVSTDVPTGAVFTDTATTEGGHYIPSKSASTEGSATGFIQQIKLHSKNHVVGIVSGSPSDTATTETGHYTPSTSASTKGTTAATTTSFIKGIRVDSKSHVIDVVTGTAVTAQTQLSYNSGSSVSNNASAVMTGLTVSNHAITYGKTNKIFSASTSDSATTADSAANATHAAAATKVDSALTINILDATGGTASTVTFNGSADETVNVPANTDTATTETGHYTPSKSASTEGSASGFIKQIKLDSKKHVVAIVSGSVSDTATTETGHYTPSTTSSTEGSATGFIQQIKLDSKKHVVGIVSGTTSYTETAVTTKNGTTGSTAAPVLSSITTGGTKGHELTLNYTNKVNSATTANSAVTSQSASTAADSAKLGGVVAANYSQTSHTHPDYVNQNAFGKIAVGSTTGTASSVTDTLTFSGAGATTVSIDATNRKITISSTDAKVTAVGNHYTATTATKTGGTTTTTAASAVKGITYDNAGHIVGVTTGSVLTGETQLSTATTGTGNVVGNLTVSNHKITMDMFSAASADQIAKLSAATTSHTANTTMHVADNDRTRWNNAWTSGVSAYTKVEELSAGTLYELKQINQNIPYVVTDQTGTTARLTASASTLSSLTEGQSIVLHLKSGTTTATTAGFTGCCTLNISLSDGTETGQKIIYYGGTTKLTTHYGGGNDIRLTYHENLTIGATTGLTGWWVEGNYYSDTNYNVGSINERRYAGNRLTRYQIIGIGEDERLYPLTRVDSGDYNTGATKPVNTVGFRPERFFYRSTTAIVAINAVETAQIDYENINTSNSRYTFNSDLAVHKAIYLRGSYDEGKNLFYLNTGLTTFYTQVPTNTANINLSDYFVEGDYYIYLGATYSSVNYFQLDVIHELFYFDGTNLVKAWANKTLGSEYTYSGISYVNSSTTIADAYSALTNEMLKCEEVIAAAFNDIDERIDTLSAVTEEQSDKIDSSLQIVCGSTYITTGAKTGANGAKIQTISAKTQGVETSTATGQGLADAYDVKQYVDGIVSSTVVYKGATATLPATSTVGDMYIATAQIPLTAAQSATGAAQTAETGDFIIARAAGKWDVIQKNLDGAVTGSLTANTVTLGDGTHSVKSLANGTEGQVLIMSSSSPAWADAQLTDTATTKDGHYNPGFTGTSAGTAAANGFTKAVLLDGKGHVTGTTTGTAITAETKISVTTNAAGNTAAAVVSGIASGGTLGHTLTVSKTNKIFSASTSDSATTAKSATTAENSVSATTATSAKTSSSAVTTTSAVTSQSASTAADSAKLGGVVAANYSQTSHTHSQYVNQNAFGKVAVGSTTGTATAATDTLTFSGAGSTTVSIDATNRKITISSTEGSDTATTETGHYSPTASASTLGSTAAGSYIKTINIDSKNHAISVTTGTAVTAQTQLSTATTGTGNVMTDITVSNHKITKNMGMTIPSWATAATKPSYTLDEVGDGATRKLSDYATSAAVNTLSSATHTHITNGDIHVTSAQKTNWTNSGTSGANAYVGYIAHSANTGIHVTSAQKTNWTNSGTSGANAYVGYIAHSANTGIHVTTADKTAWTNGANSGASAYTMVQNLSAVTLTGVSAGGTAVPVTNKVAAIPSASTNVFGVVKTGSFLTNTNGTISVSTGTTSSTVARGNHTHDEYATTATLNALSAATDTHVGDSDIHVTARQKDEWNAKQAAIPDLDQIRNNALSGASAYTRVQELSASVIANRDAISALTDSLEELSGAVWSKEFVIAMGMNDLRDKIREISGSTGGGSGSGLPAVTSDDNGKVLRVENGEWVLTRPVTVYAGADSPSAALGTEGDIFLQIS